MAYLHRVASTCGRIIPKPNSDLQDDSIDDGPIPIQDQIENLRIKITLKEKYNRVFMEELEETRAGTTDLLNELFKQTRGLRYELLYAISSETRAVQHALRSHQEFQLALTGHNVEHAIPWMDDKLFDARKHLNQLISRIQCKRRKLEDSEALVVLLEKYPKPGTLPWELEAFDRFYRIENTIEDVKVKGEAVSILHSRYLDIKYILRHEQGKYRPAMNAQEVSLQKLKDELKSLQQMLDDAIYFRQEASKNLIQTEKEASENRKERRKEMAKAKKILSRSLAHVDDRVSASKRQPDRDSLKEKQITRQNSVAYILFKADEGNEESEPQRKSAFILRNLQYKRVMVEYYETRSRRLMDVMRVSNLTFIPARMKSTAHLGDTLLAEMTKANEWRDVLVKQRDQLNLLVCHFRYTGRERQLKFENAIKEFQAKLEIVRNDLATVQKRQQLHGVVLSDLRLGTIALSALLHKNKERQHFDSDELSLQQQLKKAYKATKILTTTVEEYERFFKGAEPEKNYGIFVRAPPTPNRLIRVEEPEVEDDELVDDGLPDFKVPSRQDIKLKSHRYIQQALLRRGLK